MSGFNPPTPSTPGFNNPFVNPTPQTPLSGTRQTGFGWSTGLGQTSTPGQTSTGFGLGPGQPSTGFGLGLSSTGSTPGQPPTGFGTSTPSSTGFGLGTGQTSGFGLGTGQSLTGFGTSAPGSTSTTGQIPTGFGTSATGSTTGQPSSGLGLGTGQALTGFGTSTPSSTGFGLGTGQPSTGFGLGTGQTSTGFGTSATGSTSTPGQASTGLGTSSTPSSTGLGLGISTTGQTSTGFGTSATGSTTGQTSLGGTQSQSKATDITTGSTTGQTGGTSQSGTSKNPNDFLKEKTMREIVDEWTKELNEQIKGFNHQASEISRWEQSLIENHDKILHLNADVNKIDTEQRQLNANLQMINAQQNDLDQMLAELEKVVDKTVNETSDFPADIERRKGYELANEINRDLDIIDNHVKGLIQKINSSQDNQEDKSNPVEQIVKILNAHLHALQYADKSSKQLEFKLEEAEKSVKQQTHTMERLHGKTY